MSNNVFKNPIPMVTSNMANSVSQYRRSVLEDEVSRGLYRDGSSGYISESNAKTNAGNVIGSYLSKYAGVESISGSGGYRGSGGTVRQVPELYSPLWLLSNLNLPRDRATINGWCRSFFTLNPIVHNAILLHSTYPISKLTIKCKNEKVQDFFSHMCEELDLMNICVQMAQEYYTLGEVFVYAELDERAAKWSRLLIQNPDYIAVEHSVIAGEPNISLRPDENLKRIISSNRPADIQQRRKLDKNIIEHVKRGHNIPLSNFNIHHLARKIAPYDIRGTGLPVSCFRQLMLYDLLRESKFAQAHNMINPLTLVKIGNENYKPSPADLESWRDVFECHDEETEVLTDQGFKKFNEVIEYYETTSSIFNIPYVFGVRPKYNIKIACFNSESEAIEYHIPSAAHVYDYCSDMYHYTNDTIDIKVTPNHRMWIKKDNNWNFVEAKDINYNFTCYSTNNDSITADDKSNINKDNITKEKYNGKVWCFTVPTGLFITRRNGKITIQGNSAQYDKDFKIFCHEGVTVEKVGSQGGIIDTSNDITQLLKEIYIGLLIPQVLMDGGSDVTYANGGVTLDVLRQRYMQFRNMMTYWLRRKIFAPISKINEFYENRAGNKILVVPEVEWNHMSLFDTQDYINAVSQLTQGESKKASVQTLYKSLGLDWDHEQRNIREETIFEIRLQKEMEALKKMSLDEIRAIGPDDEIKEPIEEPLPGQGVPGETGGEEQFGGGGVPSGGAPPGGLELPPMGEAPAIE